MRDVFEKLKGGDLRSLGKADDVVSDILKNPELFAEVFDGMLSGDAKVRMRAADAVTCVLYWELDSKITHGRATKSGPEHFFKDFRLCLASTPKIILGERIQ